MADLLTGFLQRAAAEPFVFGQWDCCMILANWAVELGRLDPGAPIRGTYHDEAGWQALATEAGGLLPLVAGLLEEAGWRPIPIHEARYGDLAVVNIPLVGMESGAIRSEAGWVMKLSRGICRLRCEPLAAWRV